jgi:hypothetical protein
MKKCCTCKQNKNLNEFYKDKTKIDGCYRNCKICHKLSRKKSYKKNKVTEKERNKIWYENNKEEILKYRKKYNKNYSYNNLINKYYNLYLQEKIQIDQYFNYVEITNENVIYYVKKYNKYKSILNQREYTKNWLKINSNYSKTYYIDNKEKLAKNAIYYVKKRLNYDPIFKFKCNVRSLISGSFKRGKNQFKKNAKTENILGCTIEEFRSYIESKFTEGMTIENHGEWHLDHIIPLASAKTEEEIIKLNHYTNFQPLWASDNFRKSDKIIN